MEIWNRTGVTEKWGLEWERSQLRDIEVCHWVGEIPSHFYSSGFWACSASAESIRVVTADISLEPGCWADSQLCHLLVLGSCVERLPSACFIFLICKVGIVIPPS